MNVMKVFEAEMERFPKGSTNHSFFKQLYKKLEPDVLRESVRKELNESHANLSVSTQQYFRHHIIYTSALKAVGSNQLEQNEFAHENMELFYLNILKKYVLDDKSTEKLKFFEESRPLLTKNLENKQKSKAMKQFSKSVEGNINEFCIKFAGLVLQKTVSEKNWEKDFDSAIKRLSPRVAILDSADMKLNTIAPELQTALSLYYKELTEGIEILYKSFELFQQKIECQSKQTEIALDRSVVLKLKSECFELEVQVSTCSKSAVDALEIIKAQLKTKLERSKDDINDLSNKLEGFQILGPDYEQLVERYQLLLEKIEKQKWAIEYLKADIESKQENN